MEEKPLRAKMCRGRVAGAVMCREKKGLRVTKRVFTALAFLYAPAICLVCALASDGTVPYGLTVLLLLLLTAPFYFAFIEIGRQLCFFLEKRKPTAGEAVFYAIGALLALGILAVEIVATVLDLDSLIGVVLCFGGLLILNWSVSAIALRKR